MDKILAIIGRRYVKNYTDSKFPVSIICFLISSLKLMRAKAVATGISPIKNPTIPEKFTLGSVHYYKCQELKGIFNKKTYGKAQMLDDLARHPYSLGTCKCLEEIV